VLPVEALVNQDQDGIKQSMFHLGADQEMNSERLISTDQHVFSATEEVWLHFCPCKIKQSRASLESDQVIKDDFTNQSWLQMLLWVICI